MMTEMQLFADYLRKKAEAGRYDGDDGWYSGMVNASLDAELWDDVIGPAWKKQRYGEDGALLIDAKLTAYHGLIEESGTDDELRLD